MTTLQFCQLVPVAAWVLAVVCYVLPSRFRLRMKLLWILVLALALSKYFCFEAIGGDALVPVLPERLIWAWDWAATGGILLAIFSVCWWVRVGRRVVLPLAAWGLAAVGVWNSLSLPQVREVELRFDQLPSELEGYRIVQISDLHCSSSARRWRTEAVVELANRQNADLVCLTGDYVDGRVEDLGDDLKPLGKLLARDGVYAVTGNHEYHRDTENWKRWFQELGIEFLRNRCVFPRRSLALAGVADPHAAYKGREAPPNVAKALAAATNGQFRVLLNHRPRFAYRDFSEHKIDLQLSGHTHGGICPVISWAVSMANAGLVNGVYRLGEGYVYVSPGCGQWAGFPVRFLAPSEIAVIVLRSR